MHNQLNEGLRPQDLKNLVHHVFEVDTYKSKMGEDRDVCVISFHVNDRAPARDLMEFIEKGYNFVLDADVSSGENNDGEYSVFVELDRTHRLAEQIKELCYGVKKLTGIDDFKFKYHRKDEVHEVTTENLNQFIPNNSAMYEEAIVQQKTEDVKRFFTKTLMDNLTLTGNVITIHKPYGNTIQMEIIKEDEATSILEGIEDALAVDDRAMSEIFWLTKVLGDYSINKVGENFVFNNGSRSMLLKRIEQ